MDVFEIYLIDFIFIGNCNDIVWIDINNDNFEDVIVVGDWMFVFIFMNNGKKLIF